MAPVGAPQAGVTFESIRAPPKIAAAPAPPRTSNVRRFNVESNMQPSPYSRVNADTGTLCSLRLQGGRHRAGTEHTATSRPGRGVDPVSRWSDATGQLLHTGAYAVQGPMTFDVYGGRGTIRRRSESSPRSDTERQLRLGASPTRR